MLTRGTLLVVTGGRDFADRRLLWSTLNELANKAKAAGYPVVGLMQGGALGADALADEWAKSNGLHVMEVFPLWDAHGKSAGHKRNRFMVDVAKALERGGLVVRVVAFPGGKGTADCVRAAEGAGLQVRMISPTAREPSLGPAEYFTH